MGSHDRSRSPPRLSAHLKRHQQVVKAGMDVALSFVKEKSKNKLFGRKEMVCFARTLGDAVKGLGGVHRKAVQQLAAREDAIPMAEVRDQLLGLFADNPARTPQAIQEQARKSLGMENINIERVLKAGTIGEVSLVREGVDGPCYALKTVVPEQKRLFEVDFAIMGGDLMKSLETPIGIAGKVFDIGLVESMVKQVINIGADKDFQDDTMREFDMTAECKSMEDGNKWLTEATRFFQYKPTYFAVPSVHKVSHDGCAILMDYVEGAENLIDAFPNNTPIEAKFGGDLVNALLELYVHGLVIGSVVHADLHPGNILLTREGGTGFKPGFTLVDWGIVCQVPREKQRTVMEVLQASVGLRECCPKSSLGDLGFKLRGEDGSLSDEKWAHISKLFDPVVQVEGLDLRPVIEAMNLVTWPPWVTLWQKAAGSLTASLKHLRAKPDHLKDSMRKILRQVRLQLDCS